MNKISKKLKNSLIVKGEKDELLKFIERVKEIEIPLVSVPFPEKLSTSFVNNNWSVSKYKVEEVVFFAKKGKNNYVFIFNNDKLTYKLINVAKELFLDLEFMSVEEKDQKAVIVTKTFKEGFLVNTETSAEFNANKYSIARCFA